VEILHAILLGIIQGLTEFLPVSSSGHLEIMKTILGNKQVASQSLLMTVVLHFATALSTIVIFRNEITDIFKGIFFKRCKEDFQFSIKIILSMIPATIVGLVFSDEMESLFNNQISFVGLMLLLTGAILFLADKAKTTNKKVNFIDAIIIGLSQAIAIIPGISRSGATISTAVLLGVDKEKAAKFSFLMVVPLIIGKILKDLFDGGDLFANAAVLELSAGFLAAFITGIFACKWMIKIVKNSKLKYFSIYCFIAGLCAIIISSI
jgi:undecaprenyl-diphosphatase|tara:strand:+ start:21981 stop:22772 length:792 start_codon:yes stop_codon:yes gene_type:complete